MYKIKNLLKNNQYQKIYQHATIINQLGKLLEQSLPDNLKESCKLSNIKNNTAILQTNNYSTSTNLYYQQDTLIKCLNKNKLGICIEKIKIQTIIKNNNSYLLTKPQKKDYIISSEVSILLQNIAKELKNTNLKNAILKIAKRTIIKWFNHKYDVNDKGWAFKYIFEIL